MRVEGVIEVDVEKDWLLLLSDDDDMLLTGCCCCPIIGDDESFVTAWFCDGTWSGNND